MDELQGKLEEARSRHTHYGKLLAERSAAADTARALLAQDSTYPRKRRDIEAELRAAESDLVWISRDLLALADRVRLLESDLGDVMAHDVELAATEKARGAKAAKAKGSATNASSEAEATAGA